MIAEKSCARCKTVKSIDNFSKRGGKQNHLYKPYCNRCYADIALERAKLPENKQSIKTRRKKYYKNNKDKEIKNNKNWVENNKERRKEINNEWYKNNKDKENVKTRRKQCAKNYRKNNKDKIADRARKRRALKNNCEANFSQNDWIKMLEHYNFCCFYCCKSESECGKLTQDHKIPISKMGPHTENNIVPACVSCNSAKKDKSFEDFCANRQKYDNKK